MVPCASLVAILPAGTVIVDLLPGDFDGDGDTDIVSIDMDVGVAYPIYNDGSGTFVVDDLGQPLYPDGAGNPPEARLAGANFNNAGPDDFIVINNEDFSEINGRTFVGLGNRRFSLASFSAPAEANGIVADDFDGDGIPDLVFSDSTTASIIIGVSSGDFSTDLGANPAAEAGPIPGRRMSGAEVLKSADLDGDGLIDLVGLVSNGTEIEVALNVRDQPTPTPGETPATPTQTAVGPTPTPTPRPPTATPTSVPTAALGRCDQSVSSAGNAETTRGIAAGDLDGVGGADITVSDGESVWILWNPEGRPNTTLMNCAEDFFDTGELATPLQTQEISIPGAGDLAVLDVDGDGDLEIAVASDRGVDILVRGGGGAICTECVVDCDAFSGAGHADRH